MAATQIFTYPSVVWGYVTNTRYDLEICCEGR